MVSFRFPAVERLKDCREFRRIYQQGRTFTGEWMKIIVAPSSQLHRRVGVVCGKEISRKSVTRNRIKRRLRECFRLQKQLLKPGMDLVIIARSRPGGTLPEFDQLTAEFISLCKKAGITYS